MTSTNLILKVQNLGNPDLSTGILISSILWILLRNTPNNGPNMKKDLDILSEWFKNIRCMSKFCIKRLNVV